MVPLLNLFLLNDLTQDWEDELTLLRLPRIVVITLLWLLIASLKLSVAVCSAAVFRAFSYSTVIYFVYICYISCVRTYVQDICVSLVKNICHFFM